MNIHPELSGSVAIFNDVSREKICFPLDAHLSRFWRVVPDFPRFAHLCSHMPYASVVKSLLRFYYNAPPDSQVGAPMACICVARTLQFMPSALVPDCGAQIMVTL